MTGWDFISPAFLSICAWRIYPKGDSDLCYPRTWQEAGVDVVWESQRHTDADWAIIEVAPRRWRAFLVAITSNGEANA